MEQIEQAIKRIIEKNPRTLKDEECFLNALEDLCPVPAGRGQIGKNQTEDMEILRKVYTREFAAIMDRLYGLPEEDPQAWISVQEYLRQHTRYGEKQCAAIMTVFQNALGQCRKPDNLTPPKEEEPQEEKEPPKEEEPLKTQSKKKNPLLIFLLIIGILYLIFIGYHSSLSDSAGNADLGLVQSIGKQDASYFVAADYVGWIAAEAEKDIEEAGWICERYDQTSWATRSGYVEAFDYVSDSDTETVRLYVSTGPEAEDTVSDTTEFHSNYTDLTTVAGQSIQIELKGAGTLPNLYYFNSLSELDYEIELKWDDDLKGDYATITVNRADSGYIRFYLNDCDTHECWAYVDVYVTAQ